MENKKTTKDVLRKAMEHIERQIMGDPNAPEGLRAMIESSPKVRALSDATHGLIDFFGMVCTKTEAHPNHVKAVREIGDYAAAVTFGIGQFMAEIRKELGL